MRLLFRCVGEHAARFANPFTPVSVTASASNLHAGKYGVKMLWTIFVVLLVLWLLGIATSYTLGGFIHLLLVLAVITVIIKLFQGRSITS